MSKQFEAHGTRGDPSNSKDMTQKTPEGFAQFVTQPTPRTVPPEYLGSTSKAGGCVLAGFGLMFILVGCVAMYFFFPPRLVEAYQISGSELVAARGTVEQSEKTIYSHGSGNRHRKNQGRRVYRHEFSFVTEQGDRHTGYCFSSKKSLKAGSSVRIEYLPDDPSIARIKGSDLNPFGLLPVFVLVFPGVGFCVLFFPWRNRRRRLRLLREGTFTFAEISNIRDTKLTVNHQRVFEVTVLADNDGIPVTIKSSVRGEDASLAQQRFADSERIGILFDPATPKRALFTANLIGSR